MEANPYSSPQSGAYDAGNAAIRTPNIVSAGVIQQLAGTKPWVRLFAILMWIGAGLMLLGALAMIAGSAVFAKGGGAMGAAAMIGIGVLYALIGILYVYPALKLWKYGSRIGALLVTASEIDLEAALGEQRAFWKFAGMMVIITFVIYILAMIGLMGAGAMNR